MDEWETLADRLLSGEKGGELRSLARSGEARRLSETLDAAEAEQALRSGDSARVSRLLRQVLSTPEGKALAEKLSALGGAP
ncbi:MAG: hypothetical protein IJT62_03480 [Oscillospiraceae bacterium]|nr:hypothetical protein [Oscillospiraceae bacterium]